MALTTMIQLIHDHVLPAALSLLPAKMDSPEARAMLLAIGLQESKFQHRKQVGGPARGFFQFEYGGGVAGVSTHKASRTHLTSACRALCYEGAEHSPETLYRVIEHNDVLACVMARLLLWTLPGALPPRSQPETGYQQYIAGWRPGKPHPLDWPKNWDTAWEMVDGR